MKKILIISPEYPKETGFGGIGTANYNLAIFLKDKLGIEVTILSFSKEKSKEYTENGINVIRLHAKNLFAWYLKSTMFIIKNYKKFDLIEDPCYGGNIFFAKLFLGKKIKYIVRLHGYHYKTYYLEPNLLTFFKKIKLQIMNFMEKYIISHANYIISPSFSYKEITGFLFKIPFKKIVTIPNIFYFNNNFENVDIDNLKGKKYFLFYGRLQNLKGTDILEWLIPMLLNKYEDFYFVLIGKDVINFFKKISLYEDNIKNRIIYINHIDNKNKLYSIIKSAELVILPSHYESYGMAILESLFLGKKVITSYVGGIREIGFSFNKQLKMIDFESLMFINEIDRKKIILDIVDIFIVNEFQDKDSLKIFSEYVIQVNTIFYKKFLYHEK